MGREREVLRGRFTAHLALFISIVALVFSVLAFTRTVRQEKFNATFRHTQELVQKRKEQTTAQMKKALKEIGKGLQKLSDEIERKGNHR